MRVSNSLKFQILPSLAHVLTVNAGSGYGPGYRRRRGSMLGKDGVDVLTEDDGLASHDTMTRMIPTIHFTEIKINTQLFNINFQRAIAHYLIINYDH